MEVLFLLIGLVVGGAIGFLVARLKAGKNTEQEAALQTLTSEVEQWKNTASEHDKRTGIAEAEKVQLENQLVNTSFKLETVEQDKASTANELSAWKEKYYNLEDKLATQQLDMEKLQEKFTTEFENIANKILETKTAKFTEQNKTNLDTLLKPLNEKIKDFSDRIERTYNEETKERVSLKTEIKNLMSLNQQLSSDANNLATALKGESKTQGDWGELQLEMLLENAGLEKGRHYTTQGSFRDENDQLKRPDIIINLPENKHLIIDSKVSLLAYSNYYNAESEEARALALKEHILSIRSHISNLNKKQYQKLYDINTPDYVLLFVPLESAFSLAFRANDTLFDEAIKKDIVIVTSSTLLATLRTVSYIWKQEDQKANIQEIIRQSEGLYNKFVNYVKDMQGIGNRLRQAQGHYDDAMNKLSDGNGNLIRRVDKLRQLGINPKVPLSDLNVQHQELLDSPLEEDNS